MLDTPEEVDKKIEEAANIDLGTPDPDADKDPDDPANRPEDPKPEDKPEDKPVDEGTSDEPATDPEDAPDDEDKDPEDKEDDEPAKEDEKPEDKPEDKATEPAKETEPKKDEPDYEEKFKESSRNAQSLADAKKQLEERIDKAYLMPEPTEDEVKADLQKDNISFDELSDFEKRQAKKELHTRKINEEIRQARVDQKAQEDRVRDFVKEVDLHAIKPETIKKYPLLDGKQNALRKFAQDVPTRIGMNMDDLIELFLVKTAKPPVKNKGGMFPTGNGGGSSNPSDKNNGKVTLSQARSIREKNYAEYQRLVEQDKIDFSSL